MRTNADAIKNVMLTRAHFDAAILKVKGSLDEGALEKSERQAWEMLYNTEQREILAKAAGLLTQARLAHKKADDKALSDLRTLTFARQKDFAAIQKMTETVEKKLKKE
jgi:transitional endoplasmic reticulum ATPase